MHDIKQSYADQGFEILAVNLDKDRELADKFLKEMEVNFIVAFDEDGKSASDYKLRGMPSSYLIDRDGKVHASHIGFRDNDKTGLEQAIKSLLSK
jgi:peroxiredoxin